MINWNLQHKTRRLLFGGFEFCRDSPSYFGCLTNQNYGEHKNFMHVLARLNNDTRPYKINF